MKNSARFLATVIVSTTLSGWALQAQGPNGSATGDAGPDRRRPPKPPIDLVLDANGDEIIDADEIANGTVALQTLDANDDGVLTADEYLPQRPPSTAARSSSSSERDPQSTRGGGPRDRQSGGPLPPIVTALDTDGSLVLEAEEITAAAAALQTLDEDGDGALAAEEYRPPRPDGRDRRGRSQ